MTITCFFVPVRPHDLSQVLQVLRHPNIIHMEDVFESDMKIHMVMEIMQGGELFDYVVEKGTLSEQEASVMVRKVRASHSVLFVATVCGNRHRETRPSRSSPGDGPIRSPHVTLDEWHLALVRWVCVGPPCVAWWLRQ